MNLQNISVNYKRKFRTNSNGMDTLRCVLSSNCKSVEIIIPNIKIYPSEWNEITKNISNPSKEKIFAAFKVNVDRVIANYLISGKNFTLQDLKEAILGKVKYRTLLNAFDDCLKANKAEYKDSNIKKWNEHRRLIVKFIKIVHQKEDFWLNELNKQTPIDFKNFLLGEFGTTKYSNDYAKKVVQTINKVMRFALEMEYTDFNPFESLKIKGSKKKLPIYLNQTQVQKIANHNFTDKHLAKLAKLFVFQCYTGLAYADLQQLTSKDVKEYKGQKFIEILRQKTNHLSQIPILPEAQKVIDFFGSIDNFPKPYNHIYNKALKVIGEICEIPIKIHSHVGRKTFTDYALRHLYLSEDEVRAIIGHKDKRSLSLYGNIDFGRIYEKVFNNEQ